MAEETISIIRIETGEAVKSVNDLRENVKVLKEKLGDLDIGTTEYQETLEKLKQNQNAIKDAMYATSSSMEEVAANAKGINVVFDENNKLINKQNQSYNALVHTMADLKTRWRATSDEAKRAELGEQIKQINDQLKDMDASVGNFSRNVGDYTGSIKKALGDFPNFADPAKKAIEGVNNTASLLAANPVMGVIALITPLVVKLTESLKEDEDSMGAINKIMNAMKPVMDFFKGVLGQIVGFLTNIIDNVGEFLGNSGIFAKIVDGVVGVGNAILQFVIAPFKGVIEAIKIFKEQGVRGLGDAAKAFGRELKSGVAFKSNFESGKIIAETIIAGAKSKKDDAKDAGKEIVESVLLDLDKALAEGQRKIDEALKERLELQKELDAETEAEWEKTNAEIEQYLAEQDAIKEYYNNKDEQRAKERIETLQSVVNATSSILGSLADIYESDEKNSEKNANKIKALRIASATIDTISGALGAFMQATKTYGGAVGMAIGAAQSAAITAAGMAQIAQIRKTNVSSTSTPAAISPVVSAPASTNIDIPSFRNVRSASEEVRLNRMASDQKVILVMSELEEKEKHRKVQIAEVSF